MYKVMKMYFHEFTKEEQDKWCLSNNGAGKEYATYLVEFLNGEIFKVNSDAMEPEDASFTRDLRWIQGALEKAYQLGRDCK